MLFMMHTQSRSVYNVLPMIASISIIDEISLPCMFFSIRAHRIGQVNAVTITYFLANGSVDDILWPMIRTKMKVLGEVVEGNAGLDMVVHKEDAVRDGLFFMI